MKFFPEHHSELESLLEAHFERLVASLPKDVSPLVTSLILGGGYGRGEGGIYVTPNGTETLYNDLDYFLFSDYPSHPSLLRWKEDQERLETERLGIDVDIQCLHPRKLEVASSSMMFYDLIAGHHVIYGPKDYLEPHLTSLDPKKITLEETTRLLWNRGTGLYFAICECKIPQEDESFVHRNLAKCALALGDGLLTSAGLYTGSCRERHERLCTLPDIPKEILTLHKKGLEFKIRPSMDIFPTGSHDKILEEIQHHWLTVFLDIESKRLQKSIFLPTDYLSESRLFPEHPRWKGPLFALRDFKQRGGFLRPIFDYPRGALQRALVALLVNDEAVLESIKHWLPDCRNSNDFTSWKETYKKWWQYYQ